MLTDKTARETLSTEKRIAMALESIAEDFRAMRLTSDVLLADKVREVKERAEERSADDARRRADEARARGTTPEASDPAKVS